MSTATTRPVALRMTDAERERLLAHGGTARAAVTKLLDLADEHATCGPPARTAPPRKAAQRAAQPPRATSTAQQGATSTQQQGERMYEVQVAGRTVFRTTDPQLAERRRKREQDRHLMRKVEVR